MTTRAPGLEPHDALGHRRPARGVERRGVWSAIGIRGSEATITNTDVRLALDQTVENATGGGAPSTWPRSERVVDVAHKATYSLVAGTVADRLVAPTLERRRGVISH